MSTTQHDTIMHIKPAVEAANQFRDGITDFQVHEFGALIERFPNFQAWLDGIHGIIVDIDVNGPRVYSVGILDPGKLLLDFVVSCGIATKRTDAEDMVDQALHDIYSDLGYRPDNRNHTIGLSILESIGVITQADVATALWALLVVELKMELDDDVLEMVQSIENPAFQAALKTSTS